MFDFYLFIYFWQYFTTLLSTMMKMCHLCTIVAPINKQPLQGLAYGYVDTDCLFDYVFKSKTALDF